MANRLTRSARTACAMLYATDAPQIVSGLPHANRDAHIARVINRKAGPRIVKDYYAEGRKEALGVAVLLAVAVGGYYLTQHRHKASKPADPVEAACIEAAGREFTSLQADQVNQQMSAMQGIISTYANRPAYDEAMARLKFQDTVAGSRLASAYCARVAQCQPGKPFKPAFDACYSVMSHNDDDDRK